MPIDRGMDKEAVVHIYNALLSQKKECESVIMRWMNLEPRTNNLYHPKHDYQMQKYMLLSFRYFSDLLDSFRNAVNIYMAEPILMFCR